MNLSPDFEILAELGGRLASNSYLTEIHSFGTIRFLSPKMPLL